MFKIYFITDRKLTPREPPARVLREALDAGVEMVQVREKDLPSRQVLELAEEAAAVAAATGGEVYVNARFDIAVAAGAEGVHLPAAGLPAAEVRRFAPAGLRIGVSTHSEAEARAAEEAGADFITLGPVFETPSKARYGPPLGLRGLRDALAAVRLPVFAIGGIRPENAAMVLGLPVAGVAVISAIADAADRRGVVKRFREAARRARGGEA